MRSHKHSRGEKDHFKLPSSLVHMFRLIVLQPEAHRYGRILTSPINIRKVSSCASLVADRARQ